MEERDLIYEAAEQRYRRAALIVLAAVIIGAAIGIGFRLA